MSAKWVIADFTSDDEYLAAIFLEKLAGLMESGCRKIIIRFIRDADLEPDVLGALRLFLKRARFRWADVRIVVPSEKMRETFLLTRMDRHARICLSVEEAVEEGFTPLVKWGSVAACVLLILLYSQTIRWLLFSWRMDPYYSHGPLVVAVGLFLLWRRRRANGGAPRPSFSWKGAASLGFCVFLYFAGSFLGMASLTAVSLLFFLFGAVRLLYGKGIYRQAFLPVSLLVFSIPLPRLDELASALQHWTAAWAAAVVSKMGVEAYQVGINVFFKDLNIAVDAPCSGLRSLMALLFVGALFTGLLDASPRKKALLLLLVIPVGLFSNLLRISALILIANGFGLKTAMFYFHYVSGFLFFAAALLVLLFAKRLLRCGWQES